MAVERFPVEAGHVMTFARAVGDPNPVYADPEHAQRSEVGEIIAPPTFAIASAQFDPDYPLRPTPGEAWYGSGRGPGTVKEGAGGLHAEGRLLFTEQITEFRDQAGELVVTMRAVGVQREAAS